MGTDLLNYATELIQSTGFVVDERGIWRLPNIAHIIHEIHLNGISESQVTAEVLFDDSLGILTAGTPTEVRNYITFATGLIKQVQGYEMGS